MARKPDPEAKFRNAKPADKPQKIADDGGLYLLVTPAGAKVWRWRYRFPGRDAKTGETKLVEKTLVLGQYPTVPLIGEKSKAGQWVVGARELRDAARKLLHEGTDPARKRRADKLASQRASENTVQAICEDWIAANEHLWTPKHVERVRRRLEADAYPDLGDLPAGEVTPQDVLVVLRKIEKRGALTISHRVKEYLSAAYRFGIAEGRCASDPTRDLRDALKKRPPAEHHKFLPESEMPEFFTRLAAYDGHPMTVIAVNLLILTAVRTVELRQARWSEFQLDGAEPLWRVPATRTKMRREHLVPLSTQAVAFLRELQTISGDRADDYILPSLNRPKGCMSENTVLFALYRMGYHSKATGHGFRRLFSTVLNESGHDADHIEMQLAHVQGGVRGIYNAARYLPQRRKLMQTWADRVDGWRAGAKVIGIRRTSA